MLKIHPCFVLMFCAIAFLPLASQAETPMNDLCIDAQPITIGDTVGLTLGATSDRASNCDDGRAPDVWYRYEGPRAERLYIDSSGSSFDTVISLHRGCGNVQFDELNCNDNAFESAAAIPLDPGSNPEIYIRVSGADRDEVGDFQLRIGGPGVVTGRVTDEGGEPLGGIRVTLATENFPFGFAYPHHTETDAEGRYRIEGIRPGAYHAFTHNDQGFLDENQDGGVCPPVIHFGSLCGFEGATPFDVHVEETVTGIDFALEVGGSITGVVLDRASGEPIGGVFLSAYEGSRLSDETFSEADGSYRLHGLTAGSYTVSANAVTHADQVFAGIDCSFPYCLPEERQQATPVVVEVGQATTEIDFDLPQRATISGRVTKTRDGSPAEDVQVFLLLEDQGALISTQTDANGDYLIGGLAPNAYIVQTDSFLYFNEIYPDHACDQTYCWGSTGGEPVVVGEDEAVTDIDFDLDSLGVISGKVTDAATGEPIAGVEIPGVAEFDRLLLAVTDEDGEYRWEAIEPGSRLVSTLNVSGWIDEVYDDVACPFSRCDRSEITRVQVERNTVAENIDFALERGGAITGRITQAKNGQPARSFIDLYDEDGLIVTSTFTRDEVGSYELTGLESGRYFVGALGLGIGNEIYDGVPCDFGCDVTQGTPIDVETGQVVSGIDFALGSFGGLTGRVFDRVTGEPLPGTTVRLRDSGGQLLGERRTDAQGRFLWAGLNPITYYVSVDESEDYRGQLYNDIPCPDDSCDLSSGEQISVPLDTLVKGIDFALEPRALPCVPDATALCLNDGRFRVSTQWAAGGPFRAAEAVQLTEDSGYFWFFNSDNVELVVKALDGCSLLSNHYWFFAGGLTDVATSITVTDTWTGDRKVYDKPQGQPFASILDTRAFDTCEATRPNSFVGPSTFTAPPVFEAPVVPSDPASLLEPCVPGPETLCLNRGRFQVEALWNSPTGDGGAGQAIQLTADSGYFWFFNADNVEVVVKVLDGCAEPQNTYWVFSAGLTNVEVILRVTDTSTGDVRRYVNPQGKVFEPILDTQGFHSCP